MASYDKAIPPGGQGSIKLQVNTKGYQGPVAKTARVFTNDPAFNTATLRLTANIKVPIAVSARYVYLAGVENQGVTRIIDIRAELDRPLTLEPLEFTLAGKVQYQIEEIEKGRRFQLRLNNVPGPAETYQGQLRLKTNYPESPELAFRIRGQFSKIPEAKQKQ